MEKQYNNNGAVLFKAGVSKINITPSERIPMAGFYARQEPFTGVHDDLFARAVVFEYGGVEAALIAVDTCVLPESFWADTTSRIAGKYPIPQECIIINASHTHSGPALYTPPGLNDLNAYWPHENNPYEDKQKRYTEALKINIVSVVGEARNNLRSARIGFGKGISSIGNNRREKTPEGGTIIGIHPDGPVDRELSVVRIDSDSGETLAVMFNLGVHGTSMMTDHITGDWCGRASQYIEEQWGDGIIALFLSGASGDVNPIFNVTETTDAENYAADILGKRVGNEVIRVAENIKTETCSSLYTAQRVTSVPGKRYLGLLGFDQYYDELAKDTSPVPDTDIRMSVLKAGDIVFAGASGEIFSKISMDFKKKSMLSRVLFMGLCNGYSSYILPDDDIRHGGYEYNASVVKAGGQEAVVTTLLDMLRET